ncbi:MAG: phosphatase PAP2 family protein [Mycobacteriales bacterium]
MKELLAVAGIAALGAAAAGVAVLRTKLFDASAPTLPAAAIQQELRLHHTLRDLAQRRVHPGTVTGLALTVGVGAVVLGAAAVGLILLSIRSGAGPASADVPLARWAAANSSDTATLWLSTLSHFGGTDGVVAPALLIAGYEILRHRAWSVLGFLTLTVGGQFAVSNAVKWTVERARPDLLQLGGFAGTSFPSGHATAAAASYAAFALVLSRRHSRRTAALLAAVATAIAFATAATRVLLGVHWTTDVIAGVFLGWAWFALASVAFGGRLLTFGQPAAVAERLAPSAPAR